MAVIEERTVRLRALEARDAAVERWLRDDVAPVHDAVQADPARAVSLDDAFADVRPRHAKRLTGGG